MFFCEIIITSSLALEAIANECSPEWVAIRLKDLDNYDALYGILRVNEVVCPWICIQAIGASDEKTWSPSCVG